MTSHDQRESQVPVAAGQADLRALFAPCGEIVSINMLKRPGEAAHKGRSSLLLSTSSHDTPCTGCGFVEFATWSGCENAIDAHNGTTVMAGSKMPLVVKFADARKQLANKASMQNITGHKRGSVGDTQWQAPGKRPSLQVCVVALQ